MNPRAFQEWIGRLALVALLLLVALPTAGRLVHAAAGGHSAHAVHHAAQADLAAHANHANHANHRGASPADSHAPGQPQPAPGDAECDYCPLLASLLVAARIPFVPAGAPRMPATMTMPAAPRLPWLYPSGLGSRGPPLRG